MVEFDTYGDVILFLITNGVTVEKGYGNTIHVCGFYKSDYVSLDFSNKSITARYNEVTNFDSPTDLLIQLIKLNNVWHDRSSDRFEGWEDYSEGWDKIHQWYKEKTDGV